MFHQTAHGLGGNAVPVLTDPRMHLVYTGDSGATEVKWVLMAHDNAARAAVFRVQVMPLLGRLPEARYE